MDEIFWDDHLDPRNHAPHFPYFFTGMVDTFFMKVLHLENSALHWQLFNPKYGTCIYKGQLGIDFLGM